MTPQSMGCRMYVVSAGMKTLLISDCISIRALGGPGALSMSSNYVERNLFLKQ